jgi:hypothetical protein
MFTDTGTKFVDVDTKSAPVVRVKVRQDARRRRIQSKTPTMALFEASYQDFHTGVVERKAEEPMCTVAEACTGVAGVTMSYTVSAPAKAGPERGCGKLWSKRRLWASNEQGKTESP